MTATFWIWERYCRVLVEDAGYVIDMIDDWNNRASAEMCVAGLYPEAICKFVSDPTQITELNREWNTCKLGQG